MSDIDISISAQETASKILDSVENALGSLVKESADAAKAVSKATAKIDVSFDSFGKVADEISHKANSIGKSVGSSLMSVAKGAAGFAVAMGALKAVSATFDAIAGSGEAFRIQEEAARGASDAQLQFAVELQKATNIGDEATLAFMKQAEMLGVQKDLTDEVTIAAYGLAEALGINQEEALKKVNQAINGNANAFAEFLPEMRHVDEALARGAKSFGDYISAQQGLASGQVMFEGTIRSVNELTEAQLKLVAEQAKLEIVNRTAAAGMAELQATAGTTTGMMARASGAFGDLQEIVGKIVDPIQNLMAQGFAVFAETLQSSLLPAINTMEGALASLQPVFDALMKGIAQGAVVVGVYADALLNNWSSFFTSFTGGAENAVGFAKGLEMAFDMLARGAVTAITFIETGWTNLGTVFQIGIDYILLQVEKMRADIEHIFTSVLPAYGHWFGENFLNLMRDYFSAVTTVMSNFADKVVGFWSTIINFVSSGFEGGLSGLSRQLGEALGGGLLEGFEATTQPLPEIAARALTEREEYLNSTINAMSTSLADEFNTTLSQRLDDLNVQINGTVDVPAPDLSAIANEMKVPIEQKIKVDIGRLQADEQRLVTRGAQEDPTRQVAENTRALVEVSKGIGRDVARELAPLLPQPAPGLTFTEVA